MTNFKFYIAKRRTYIRFDEKLYYTNNNWADHSFTQIEIDQLPVSLQLGWQDGEAQNLNDAYQVVIQYQKQAAEQREQDNAVWAAKSEIMKIELVEKAKILIANQPIPATVDNIRVLAHYLNLSNWGGWVLPKMTIGYSANQYDCDGKTATTIQLNEAITDEEEGIYNATKFVVGAPRGHLSKYQRI